MTKNTNSKHRGTAEYANYLVSDIGPPEADAIYLEFGAKITVHKNTERSDTIILGIFPVYPG
jgi:hypothetical protein